MKKFKFKLETVLTERKKIEDLRFREWNLAQMLLGKMVDELSKLKTELEDAFDQSTLFGSVPTGNVGLLTAVESHITGTKLRITWKQGEIERAKKLTDRKRWEYVMARQKREAIEKLKEKRLVAYKAENKKRELRILDDIYIMGQAFRKRLDGEAEI